LLKKPILEAKEVKAITSEIAWTYRALQRCKAST